jgi:quinol monooxygenase YgiN
MPEPIAFIIRHRIKEGRGEEFRRHYRDSVPRTLESKPRTSAQLAYENPDGTEVTLVRLFRDADALDLQLQGADERSKITYEFIQPLSIEIFGEPGPSTLERMKKIASSGVAVDIHPTYLGGFIR